MNREHKIRKDYLKKVIIKHTHAMVRLFASSAAKLSCRQVQAVITEIIAHTVCQVSIWTMSPETVRQTAEVLWRQSVYGSEKTANGRSFIGAGYVERSTQTASPLMITL